eukprot:m.122020 g.122020  ORF g.122020 m.122020 type:complete len:4758 (-) comp13405_c0_seq2:212-14485(-)
MLNQCRTPLVLLVLLVAAEVQSVRYRETTIDISINENDAQLVDPTTGFYFATTPQVDVDGGDVGASLVYTIEAYTARRRGGSSESRTPADYFNYSTVGVLGGTFAFDFEVDTTHILDLRVDAIVSNGTVTSFDFATVVIEVSDFNDNNPVFDPSGIYTASVVERFGVSTVGSDPRDVLAITATDADAASFSGEFQFKQGYVEFVIVDGDETPPRFQIHDPRVQSGAPLSSTTVMIQTTGLNLDRERKATYNLTVMATDNCASTVCGCTGPVSCSYIPRAGIGSARSVNHSIVITILDINDNVPIFLDQSLPIQVNVTETNSGNAVAITPPISATDADSGENGSLIYFISGGNERGLFSINSSSGSLRTNGTIDRESDAYFLLAINVTDRGSPSLQSATVVNISVLDANEFAPSLSISGLINTISESTSVGTVLAVIVATDADSTFENSAVRFYVSTAGSGDDPDAGEIFDVDDISGEITLRLSLATGPFDHDNLPRQGHYTFTIVASNVFGNPIRNSSLQTTITVIDSNDNFPQFDVKNYSVNVPETTNVGTTVLTVTATDRDEGLNGSVGYSILSGNSGGEFAINATSGVISVESALDRETTAFYVLTVEASDVGSPSNANQTTVEITIVDANDNVPRWNQSAYAGTIVEDANIGTQVGTAVLATDSDDGINGVVRYAVVGGDLFGQFSMDATTGVLSVAAGLNREQIPTYTLTVTATDTGVSAQTNTTVFTVVVGDANDNVPQWIGEPYAVSVSEDVSVGTDIFSSLVASDADIGVNSNLSYSIIAGNSHGHFSVNSHSGVITVVSGLNRENISSYTLSIRVIDGGAVPLHNDTTLVILVTDVNDNSPIFNQSSYTTVLAEDTVIGTRVGVAVSTNDADLDRNGELESFVISAGNTDQKFAIDHQTGVITLIDELDYENTTTYTLTIRASDNGTVPLYSDVTYTVNVTDVNDNDPVFDQSTYFADIGENAAPRSIVGLPVHATDRDSGSNGVVSYSLEAGDGSSQFDVNVTSGQITVSGSLDREITSVYSLTVRATDGGTPTRTATAVFTVTVTDVNDNFPQFLQPQYTASVSEDVSVGTSVGVAVVASDSDLGENGTVSYRITSGNDSGNFAMNTTSGVITVAAHLDREHTPAYTLTVVATDGGNPPKLNSTSFTITLLDVNDNFPQWNASAYSGSVFENATVGSSIGTAVKATDEDVGNNGAVIYSIVSGNEEGRFRIDSANGSISVAAPLDRETTATYNLVLSASDAGAPSNTNVTVFSIDILDINDNSPVFNQSSYSAAVREDAIVGLKVGNAVAATDADIGDNGVVTFEIIGGNSEGRFALNRSSGVVSVVATLDREITDSFELTIVASDGGTPSRRVQTTYSIAVDDVNDNTPQWDRSVYSADVVEDVSVGTQVGVPVLATDLDHGENGSVTYSILLGNDQGHFSLDNLTGVLRVVSELDRESTDSYVLTVRASDSANPALSNLTTYSIRVTDVNDNHPIFNNVFSASVFENVSIGAQIGIAVNATDADIGVNGHWNYAIVGGNIEGKFQINATSGVVSTVQTLDRETTNAYALIVEAFDFGTTPRTNRTTFSVIVLDVNDNDPQFLETSYSVTVFENLTIGSQVGILVSASDLDIGANSLLSFNFVEDPFPFAMNSTSGVVSLIAALDREETAGYAFTVRVTDAGNPPRFNFANWSVVVADVNDNDPIFNETEYSAAVVETASLGSFVLAVSASDTDVFPNSNISYSILQGNLNDTFAIAPLTGIISLVSYLDREITNTYALLVQARDHGLNARSALVNVSITVLDANDNIPVFINTPYVTSVSEDVSVGTELSVVVTATDADQGQNSHINFALIGGPSSRHFSINQTSGVVSVAAPLDRELISLFLLTVRATDSGSPSHMSETNYSVEVLDVNDNFPIFNQSTYFAEIPENATVGTQVGVAVLANDADVNNNGRITYSIVAGNNDQQFAIHSGTGVVTVSATLDREVTETYTLTIQATDSASTGASYAPKSNRTNFTVLVLDVNSESPIFQAHPQSLTVPENSVPGLHLYTFLADDADAEENGRVSYYINDTTNFVMNASSGELTTNNVFDFEARQVFFIEVTATDNGVPPLATQTIVTVNIANRNDVRPEFTIGQGVVASFRIEENLPPCKFVVDLDATDADYGNSSQQEFVFSVVSGPIAVYNATSCTVDLSIVNPALQPFILDPSTGEIKTTRPLDRESVSSYLLTVMVEDRPVSRPDFRLHSFIQLQIIVTDTNDNRPEFLVSSGRGQFEAVIPSTAGSGRFVTSIIVADADAGNNASLSLVLDSFCGQFLDVNNFGTVTTSSISPPPSLRRLDCVVTASDSGTPISRNATIALIVYRNDAPQITIGTGLHAAHTCVNVRYLSSRAISLTASQISFQVSDDFDGDETGIAPFLSFPNSSDPQLNVFGLEELPVLSTAADFNDYAHDAAQNLFHQPLQLPRSSPHFHGYAFLAFRIVTNDTVDIDVPNYNHTVWRDVSPFSNRTVLMFALIAPDVIHTPYINNNATSFSLPSVAQRSDPSTSLGATIQETIIGAEMEHSVLPFHGALSAVPAAFCADFENSTEVALYNLQVQLYNTAATYRQGKYPGVAVIGINNSRGHWFYSSHSSPVTWVRIANVSKSSALILTNASRLLFSPTSGQFLDFVGVSTASIRLWDGTGNYFPGNYVNVLQEESLGRFSSTDLTISARVSQRNDQPIVTNAVVNLTPVPYAYLEPLPHTAVLNFVSDSMSQADISRIQTQLTAVLQARVVVVNQSHTQGVCTGTSLGTSILFNAFRLGSSDAITLIEINETFSSSTAILELVNPLFVGSSILPADALMGPANVSCNALSPLSGNGGTSVTDLVLLAGANDEEDPVASLGIAITSFQPFGTSPGRLGVWQYRSIQNPIWRELPVATASNAFKLMPTDKVRFSPISGVYWDSETPTLSFKVYDSTLDRDRWVDASSSDFAGLSVDTVMAGVSRSRCDPNLGSCAMSTVQDDVCGVSGGNGSTCAGCDYVPFSRLVVDDCGKCNGQNLEKDCNGVCNGTASTDYCGVCSGGNTGLSINSTMDCRGVCNSSSTFILNDCGECVDSTSNEETQRGSMDCSGVCGGLWVRDDCNVCQPPQSHPAFVDQHDCSGQCLGDATIDVCGTCISDTSSSFVSDPTLCAGYVNEAVCGCPSPINSCDNTTCGVAISSLKPAGGPVETGTTVALSGAGFTRNMVCEYLDEVGGSVVSAGRIIFVNDGYALCPAKPCTQCSTTGSARRLQLRVVTETVPVVLTNSAPLFTYFNTSTISVSSLSQTRGLVGTNLSLRLIGTGFLFADNSSASCYIPSISKTFSASIISNTEVVCTVQLPMTSENLTISFLPNGVANDVASSTQLSVSLIAEAQPASVISARLSPLYNEVRLTWSHPVVSEAEALTFDCATILFGGSESTVSILEAGNISDFDGFCRFESDYETLIRFPVGLHNVVPGRTFNFSNVFRADEAFSVEGRGEFTVFGSSDVPLKADIVAPGEIPQCGTFLLSATFSTGSSESGLLFRWEQGQLFNGTWQSTVLTQCSSVRCELDSSAYLPHVDYSFILTVSDPLRSSRTATLLRKVTSGGSVVTIRAPSNGTRDRMEAFYLDTHLSVAHTLPNCDVQAPSEALYSWSMIRCVTAQCLEVLPAEASLSSMQFGSAVNTSMLRVDPTVLFGAAYMITVSVTQEFSSTSARTIVVFSEPSVTCQVIGGDRIVDGDTAVSFLASVTPESTLRRYRVLWTCRTAEGRVCSPRFGNATEVITFPSPSHSDFRTSLGQSVLDTGHYVITASVFAIQGSEELTSCSSSINVTYSSVFTSTVQIEAIDAVSVSPDKNLLIRANVSASETATNGTFLIARWTSVCDPQPGWPCLNLTESVIPQIGPAYVSEVNASLLNANLMLKPGVLAEGLQYTFRLEGWLNSTRVISASIVTITIPQRPTPQILTLNKLPPSVESLSLYGNASLYQLEATAADNDVTQSPTLFVFVLSHGNSTIALTDQTVYPLLSTLMPSLIQGLSTVDFRSPHLDVIALSGPSQSTGTTSRLVPDPSLTVFSASTVQAISTFAEQKLQYNGDWSSALGDISVLAMDARYGQWENATVRRWFKRHAAGVLIQALNVIPRDRLLSSLERLGNVTELLAADLVGETSVAYSIANAVLAVLNSLSTSSTMRSRRQLETINVPLTPLISKQLILSLSNSLFVQNFNVPTPGLVAPARTTTAQLVDPTLAHIAAGLAMWIEPGQDPLVIQTPNIMVTVESGHLSTALPLAGGFVRVHEDPITKSRVSLVTILASPLVNDATIYSNFDGRSINIEAFNVSRIAHFYVISQSTGEFLSRTVRVVLFFDLMFNASTISTALSCNTRSSPGAAWVNRPGVYVTSTNQYQCTLLSSENEAVVSVRNVSGTHSPTATPSAAPSGVPTASPTARPTLSPTAAPIPAFVALTETPTAAPTRVPTTITVIGTSSGSDGATTTPTGTAGLNTIVLVILAVVICMLVMLLIAAVLYRRPKRSTKIHPGVEVVDQTLSRSHSVRFVDNNGVHNLGRASIPPMMTLGEARPVLGLNFTHLETTFRFATYLGDVVDIEKEYFLTVGGIANAHSEHGEEHRGPPLITLFSASYTIPSSHRGSTHGVPPSTQSSTVAKGFHTATNPVLLNRIGDEERFDVDTGSNTESDDDSVIQVPPRRENHKQNQRPRPPLQTDSLPAVRAAPRLKFLPSQRPGRSDEKKQMPSRPAPPPDPFNLSDASRSSSPSAHGV